jgi:hypothetical protein
LLSKLNHFILMFYKQTFKFKKSWPVVLAQWLNN